MKVFVTGIGGFLGGSIAAHMRSRGHTVSGSSRRQGACRMELGESFDASVFEGVDAVVHCAHDFSAGAAAKNIDGTKAWQEAAAVRGVRQQVFLSSYSAGAGSEYGRIKNAIEPGFLSAGQCVVRPGLVIGNGGLFQKQRAALVRTPLIPMIGSGAQPTALIGLTDLLEAIANILERDLRGAFNLFYEPQPTYREFVTAVKEVAGQRARFVPIPTGAALAVTATFEKLRLPFPVKPGQIAALASNASNSRRSDLYTLLGAPSTLEAALKAAC